MAASDRFYCIPVCAYTIMFAYKVEYGIYHQLQEAVGDTLEELWISYNNIEKLKGINVLKKLKVCTCIIHLMGYATNCVLEVFFVSDNPQNLEY